MTADALQPSGSGNPAATAPLATVIIVNYNGAHLLRPCLEALGRQTMSGQFNTWVVDNASVDGSLELLRRDFPDVHVIPSAVNTGFAGGNNLALRDVTTPFVALLNNDATPEPDWLERLLAPLREPDHGGAAPRVGATTSKILFLPRFVPLSFATETFVPGPHDTRELGVRIREVQVNGEPVTDAVLWERSTYGPEGTGADQFRWSRPKGEFLVPVPEGARDATSFTLTLRWTAERDKPLTLTLPDGSTTDTVVPTGRDGTLTVEVPADKTVDVVNNVGGVVLRTGYGADRGYQEIDRGQYDSAEDVFLLCGAACAFRSDVLRDVGVFDPDFFLYYEDTDLSWRLHAMGYAIRYTPDAVVRHVHSATSKEWSPTFVFHVDRNRLLMLTKNATADLAVREVLHYPLTTASMTVRAVRTVLAERRRPAVRPLLLRWRVIASYLRLLPDMLAKRHLVGRSATVSRRELQQWLVERR